MSHATKYFQQAFPKYDDLNESVQENVSAISVEKAFVRGSFLGGGSVNNPKNNYHLEIIFSSEENASIILEILSKYEINFKKIENPDQYEDTYWLLS